ncbi:hypothetical protein [uncultured Propionibacterium sp.]|uniref:hypothetical protein n=1 Tax=uncultured Propionibacterium sp. TaxID=218066 RepID=UPI00293055C3|nr:hypothetical protein [uncultured Propionibacterium sp.]
MSDETDGDAENAAAGSPPPRKGPAWNDVSKDLTWADLANTDVPLGRKDAPQESDPTDSLDTKEREQVLTLREKLFDRVDKLVTVALIGGFILMVIYMIVRRGDLDYRVVVAWYSGVAVQTIGVLAVIAKNLFPADRARR